MHRQGLTSRNCVLKAPKTNQLHYHHHVLGREHELFYKEQLGMNNFKQISLLEFFADYCLKFHSKWVVF